MNRDWIKEDLRLWICRWLDQLEWRQTGNGPTHNGFSFAAIPEWELRQKLEAIDKENIDRLESCLADTDGQPKQDTIKELESYGVDVETFQSECRKIIPPN